MIDKFYMWLADKLPRKLCYYCMIREATPIFEDIYRNQHLLDPKYMNIICKNMEDLLE